MFKWFKKKDNRERVFLHVVKEYSDSTGARYEHEAKFSGERFRTELLYPKLSDVILRNKVLVVNLDGAFGYGVAFLEEAFGGLIRVEGELASKIKEHLEIVSDEEPSLVNEIMNYLDKAIKNV